MNQKTGWKVLLAGLVLAACGPSIVGSRYVKSWDATGGQAQSLTVESSESNELAGTRLDIPAGALAGDTRITIELGLSSILGAELSAGPVAVFGPVGTTFSSDVTLMLPVSGVGSTDDIGIVAQDEQGLTWEIDPNQVALNTTRTYATFRIRRLATYQPRRRLACQSTMDCASGLQCVNGRCQTPTTTSTDGGPGCPMSCPGNSVCDPARGVCTQNNGACMTNSDCPSNLACVNGACQVPSTGGCGLNGCASGQVCTNGMCVVDPGDGGSTNPNACMSDRDCASSQRCVNGACRSACMPAAEVCNMIDDDCDGLVDEGCSATDGGVFCGGFAGVQCPSGLVCVYGPNCDPMNGGADCDGTCESPNPTDGGMSTPDGGADAGSPDAGLECGGLAGVQCPSGLTCVYGPACNPMTGADCTGTCAVVADGGTSANACRTGADCIMNQQCVNGFCR